DRRSQVRFQRLARAEGCIHVLFENAPGRLASFLGCIKSKVGPHRDLVQIAIAGRENHDTTAGLDGKKVPGNFHLALDLFEYLVEPPCEIVDVDNPIKVDHELVAAKTADLYLVADAPAQTFGNSVDETVANRVAQRVIDRLEVVEINDGEAAEAVLVATRHEFADHFLEIGAVRQTCQAVVARHVTDLLLGRDALRDLFKGKYGQFFAAFTRREFQIAAVAQLKQHLAPMSLVQRLGKLAARTDEAIPAQERARHPTQQKRVEGAADHLFGKAEAQVLGSALVRHNYTTVRIEHDQAVRHGVQGAVKPLGYAISLLAFEHCTQQELANIGRAFDDDQTERYHKERQRTVAQFASRQECDPHRQKHGDRKGQH